MGNFQRTSRVEKPRPAQRDRRTPPSWYRRALLISFKENGEVNAYDFDEDLSELEEDKEQGTDDIEPFQSEDRDDPGCECDDEDLECNCKFENDNMGEDDGSERSYDGSDADYYYELKEERDERKQAKLRERKEKERQRDIEKTREEEVRVAYRSLNKAEKERKTVPAGPLAGQSFQLFCSDHVDLFYSDFYVTKRVDFYYLDDTSNPGRHNQKPGRETDMLYGDVYLNANANCNFGPFCPPKRASRKAFKVRSCDGMYELSFKFLGGGYLKLRVYREILFMNPYSPSSPAPPAAAPEVFEFVGIRRDREKEKGERQERMTNSRRSPSPRESWFEMNHPMGSWSIQ
ncbi:uncharacterized protein PV06_05408 [Exophiala oligosperma]|uniref:Uncharacterized protein n=1 Tax=Exophiala oligosperma TaxID=215243 RepID=A0A0D2DHA5_9EURO|nr:uncharacterized protein PV06_05408 [Exophiala oligosperma]KIW41795.1 hypothetical protein PV06_05408 [Exophiala oligosperma]